MGGNADSHEHDVHFDRARIRVPPSERPQRWCSIGNALKLRSRCRVSALNLRCCSSVKTDGFRSPRFYQDSLHGSTAPGCPIQNGGVALRRWWPVAQAKACTMLLVNVVTRTGQVASPAGDSLSTNSARSRLHQIVDLEPDETATSIKVSSEPL